MATRVLDLLPDGTSEALAKVASGFFRQQSGLFPGTARAPPEQSAIQAPFLWDVAERRTGGEERDIYMCAHKSGETLVAFLYAL